MGEANLAEITEQLRQLRTEATAAFAAASSAEQLEAARVRYLGHRQGQLQELEALFKSLSPEEKRVLGRPFNETKKALREAFQAAKERLAELGAERARRPDEPPAFDFTLPGTPLPLGTTHPLTQTIQELIEIFGRLGFQLASGPEVEDEWHNFEALNIPITHPARDPADNFCIDERRLLRSQTSTVQIRVMERQAPPVRVIAIGRVYRPDTMDATHSCMFHQVEGLYVDERVTMADLKTTLRMFAAAYLGPDIRIRFRPSFFPFTEPSVEVDMSWQLAAGRSQLGVGQWVELGGAGMVDPNVLAAVGCDPEKYSGFAFGLGVERLCMRRYGISDIRWFYENDLRFLRQF